LLAPHFYANGFTEVSARLLGNARLKAKRGGVKSWVSVRAEILKQLRHDQGHYATLFVDYYGMPAGHVGWPGRAAAGNATETLRANIVCDALRQDFEQFAGEARVSSRFIPFVLVHEFEALRFSDCRSLADAMGKSSLAPQLQAVRDDVANPEAIDESPQTAPSKRILTLNPRYSKVLMGAAAAQKIGLDTIRAECPRFDRWLRDLEALPQVRVAWCAAMRHVRSAAASRSRVRMPTVVAPTSTR
jgi:hypothetical protein